MYSKDTVKLAVAYREAGHTLAEVEAVFGMTRPTYYACKEKLDDGYYDRKRPPIERRRKIDKAVLKETLAEKPDSFHHELAAKFDCKPSSVSRMIEKLKMTRKKNFHLFRSVGRKTCCFLETFEACPEEQTCLHR